MIPPPSTSGEGRAALYYALPQVSLEGEAHPWSSAPFTGTSHRPIWPRRWSPGSAPATSRPGGPTAITIHLSRVEDGVHVRLGAQEWLGTAASLGQTALMALLRPQTLLSRLDDVAQDIYSLQLVERIWEAIERTVHGLGASFQISERLRRLTCAYCTTTNPVGAPSCAACGAPLGFQQPVGCPNCGFVSH